MGAVVAPIYKAHRDLTTAFTIGAGSTYTATTLFAPSPTAVLYHAAASSFQCVAERGRVVIAADATRLKLTEAICGLDEGVAAHDFLGLAEGAVASKRLSALENHLQLMLTDRPLIMADEGDHSATW